MAAGTKRLNVNFRLDHPGKLTFSVTSNAMALSQVALARKNEPNLEGTVQVKADGYPVQTVAGNSWTFSI